MSAIVSNRLEREARRTASVLRLGAELEFLFAVVRLSGWLAAPSTPDSDLLQVAGAALGCALTWWMSRRWAARAEWYRSTDEWWLHLDDAPPVVPFPRLTVPLHRPLFRRTRAAQEETP